jgi:3-phosphoshikimate 1-carboxyvinyltransferase
LEIEIGAVSGLRGEVTPPPDKSISHRAVILASISRGRSVIRNFLMAGDTMSTLDAFRALGVEITVSREIVVEGRGIGGLREPVSVIDCGNSGTTMRLLSGVISGNPFFSVLSGDESLSLRPMERVVGPLGLMGARIMGRGDDRYPPLAIRGGGLVPIRYDLPVASAQVKSAVLLAGLYAGGVTEVIEKVGSRDHTERMLPSFGARLQKEGPCIRVSGGVELTGTDVEVPGDFSSAAFFISAALVTKGSELTIRGVGLNPTRAGLLDVIQRMGGDVEVSCRREVSGGEPVADLHCRSSRLMGVEIGGEEIPSLIDEFPVLCVLASYAEGRTEIRGAGELRVKESDRIRAMSAGLGKMGVEVDEYEDGLGITGGGMLRGAPVESFMDHRVAMSFAVAALAAGGGTKIKGAEAVDISYPGFFDTLRGLFA